MTDNATLDLPPVRDLRQHDWVDSVEDVSIEYERTVTQVRFKHEVLPEFILQADSLSVLEVYVDIRPTGILSKLVSDERARDYGWGQTALTALVEVDAE